MPFFHRDKPLIARRGLHFDLKGTPPTPRRQIELVELMAQARLNLALVEWEDTFCWSSFPELRNETAYSERHVGTLLRRSEELGIEVVPLVQCLGHMENVLIRRRFRHLREVPDVPGDLCPLNPEGRKVVARMIDDVIRIHGARISHFHLGGDEAGTLGSCPRCRKFASRHGRAALYIQHVLPLLEHLLERGIRPILWDDMMREWTLDELKRISAMADLMAWSYGADVFERFKPDVLDRYARSGATVWGASCFKGESLCRDVPESGTRIQNILSWTKEASKRPMAGLVATGWGRYSTLMVPSETIESALDMLVLAGAAFWDGSLPPNAVGAAGKFLCSGTRRSLAGKRFERCVKASMALKEWRESVSRSLEWAECQAQFAGEPDRTNERYLSRRGFDGLMREGDKIGRDFIRAHSGLIPAIWLGRYVKSRTVPLRRRIDAIYGIKS